MQTGFEMNKIEKIENLLCLALTKDIGTITVNRLLSHFGSSDNILGASEEELRKVKGLRSNQLQAVLSAVKVDPRPELDLAADNGVKIIAYDDPLFPKSLLYSPDPPYMLYIKGELKPGDIKAVGIVGTRHASRYGREQAERFGRDLAQAGYTVVSGLARGIDTLAHRGALLAGGRTIAVIGSGLLHVYPPENRDLFTEIASSAAVISEFSMDTSPSRNTFPRRNRIIAGMSLGVLVVEAPLRSGALITARQTLQMGREVFALPGMVDQEQSQGCHKLIRDGAILTTSVRDIIAEIGDGKEAQSQGEMEISPSVGAGRAEGDEINTKEERILAAMGGDNFHIDELCAELKMSVAEVSSTLMIMELRGLVVSEPGGFYRKI